MVTLIADDLKKWHDVAERNLFYFGFKEFLHAYDIKEGLMLYEASKPGLVITDINFDTSNPKNLDGLVLCRQIRDKTEDTIVVVMTSIEGIKETAIAHGAHYFIQKRHFKEEIEAFVKSHYSLTQH
ncbi:MAG: response regulator [archaeon]